MEQPAADALARTSSARERTRAVAAQALAAALERDAARASAELAAVRRAMLAVRAAVGDSDAAHAPLSLADLEESELLVRICSRLSTKDLGRLACVSAIFGRETAWSRGRGAEQRSVVEESARRWVVARSGEEQEVVAQWACWLRRMHEIQTPTAVFARSHPSIDLSEGGAVATKPSDDGYSWEGQQHWEAWQERRARQARQVGSQTVTARVQGRHPSWGRYCPAASAVVMRDGRHYAEFTLRKGSHRRGQYMYLGLIRPSWGVEGALSASPGYPDGSFWNDRGREAHQADGHCFYGAVGGLRCPAVTGDWQGRQSAQEGDTIGLLLDFDSGSLSVFKNAQRLGVMATGLEGAYSWAVSLDHEYGKSVRIKPAPAPAAPTAAEVAAALALAAPELAVARRAAAEANLRLEAKAKTSRQTRRFVAMYLDEAISNASFNGS